MRARRIRTLGVVVRSLPLRWLAMVALGSCREIAFPSVEISVPATLVAVASPQASVVAGEPAGVASVKVLDAAGAPVRGAVVTFTISRGGGQVGAPSVKSGDDGIATSTYRAASTLGLNEITASVAGVAVVKFSVTATPGAPRAVSFSQRRLRYSASTDTLAATATPRDSFGNATGTSVAWTLRDSTLVGVTPFGVSSAAVRVLKRPGTTWLVASSATARDSLVVVVPDSSSTPCSFQATPVALAPGGSLQFDGGTTCVRTTEAGVEYVVVAHLGTAAYSVSQSFEVVGEGITAPPGAFPDPASLVSPAAAPASPPVRDLGFERRMRAQEGREVAPRLASARAQFSRSSFAALPLASNILPAAPTEGQVVSLNVNALSFCGGVDARNGRIVAISRTAIIIADVANPEGGFTDDEYRALGAQLDTLITPIDTAAFGSPTDIDHNGRVAVFFTRAVNELTPSGSPGGVVLGFYYLRDLLPRRSSFGDCPGSNGGEMFYLLVPDPLATVNGNARAKAFVSSTIVGTLAHEYQHLINASRRMYVTDAIRVDEDVWLNEGLSHIAEELVFYRAAGLQPRANIDGSQLALGSAARTAFDNYQRSNFARYQQFLRLPESNSPLADDDQLATRGATWSFLRYLVDRVRTADGDFWRKVVNSRWTGAVNLDSALAGTGVTTLSAMRDWSTAVIADDHPSTTSAALQQPSWNFISSFAGAGGTLSFALVPRVLFDGLSTAVGVVGGGTSYLRFGVAQNREALIQASALGGGPLPAGIRLTLVRIK